MNFCLTILGVNSATPAHGRFPTAQVLQIHHHYFLIDCGEGCQIRMTDFGIPRHKTNQIFISHLHGDHVFGLPGLLFSYSLNDRKEPLHLFSPPGLEEMVSAQLKPSGGALSFPLYYHVLDTSARQLVFDHDALTVHSFPLKHRIPTVGFVFKEKLRPRNIRPEKIEKFQIPIPQIRAIKAGEDLTLPNGKTIPNCELTFDPPKPRSFAFVSDTIYDEAILPFIEGVDLLYHEATFCHDLAEYAAMTMHSTAKQAAMIAKKARVGKLIIGHFSSRYIDLSPLLEEAKAEFPDTLLGEEGERYEV